MLRCCSSPRVVPAKWAGGKVYSHSTCCEWLCNKQAWALRSATGISASPCRKQAVTHLQRDGAGSIQGSRISSESPYFTCNTTYAQLWWKLCNRSKPLSHVQHLQGCVSGLLQRGQGWQKGLCDTAPPYISSSLGSEISPFVHAAGPALQRFMPWVAHYPVR